MKQTGVFATAEEKEKAQELATAASNTPVIALSSADALSGRDLSSMAWKVAQEYCHKLALEHRLPEIPGYYGMTRDGEFVIC